jgi:hypothetical protein
LRDLGAMEVCSSTEMGAPGASHLGTGDRGPKTDRSRPRSVPVNALPDARSRQGVNGGGLCARPVKPFELSRPRGGRYACYAPHVMPQRNGSNCGSRTRSFSKYSKANSLQMSEKIEFP